MPDAVDTTPAIESSAFLVEGDMFTLVGWKGDRQPPAGPTSVDFTGKTLMPARSTASAPMKQNRH